MGAAAEGREGLQRELGRGRETWEWEWEWEWEREWELWGWLASGAAAEGCAGM